jgi:hypothetical protein
LRSCPPAICLSALLTAAAGAAKASEGLKYAAAYMCDPVRVTQAATQVCTASFPKLSGRYSDAYQQWLRRNENDIVRLQDECKSQLRRLAAGDAQFQEMMRQVDELNTEAIGELTKRDGRTTASFCTDVLSGMETGGSDLNRYFPSK